MRSTLPTQPSAGPSLPPWRRATCALLFAFFSLSIAPITAVTAAQPLLPVTQTNPAIPQRIVSLSPHITELLFAAGLGERVIAVDEASDFPEIVVKLPKVATYRGSHLEAIIALRPDTVALWPSATSAAERATLSQLGLRLIESSPSTLSAITADLRRFAAWAAPADRAQALARAAAADALQRHLQTRYAHARKVRVFYQLSGDRLFTLNRQHPVSTALTLCGAENIFDSLPITAPEVSREAVLAARPDAVLVGNPVALTAVRKEWQIFSSFPPNQDPLRIASVDGERLHRPTLRLFDALPALCDHIDAIRASLTAPTHR